MKELSIEEKAKRYDEILARAKGANVPYYKEDIMSKVKEFVDYLLPELKESEDEKIRKELIDYLKEFVPFDDTGRYIAWLEKQGEQKAIKHNNDATIDSNLNDYCCKVYNALHKENGGNLSFARLQHLAMDIYKWCKEQKPVEWSEEDEENLYHIDALIKDSSLEVHRQEYLSNWLKSLKDRVQPQPKQEWGGGDEAHLHSLITHLEQWIERHPNTTGADIQGENITWLKSLRPQSTWKPSEEQMAVLNEVINYAANSELQHWSDFIYTLLKSLREQLKKLREE
jgi:hypothetical protein